MISIIIPVYNSESTLERCLNSIVRQTYNDLEVIVIDDGSKDESLKIINSFNSRIDNLKIIRQDNSGVSVARNNGIQSAKGEYVLFLDSDDFLDDHCCEKAIENIVDSDLVIFGLNIYKNNIILRKPSLPNEKINLKNNIDNYWKLRTLNLGPCNKLYKRNLILQLYDEKLSLGEDTKFVLDYMSNIETISVLSDCLYNVCLDNDSSLNRKFRDDRLDQLIVVRNYEENILKNIYHDLDERVYNEYVYDAHVILHDIVKRKLSFKYLKANLQKFDYNSIRNKVKLKNKYYSLFFLLLCYKKSRILYLLLKLRIIIEKIKGVG